MPTATIAPPADLVELKADWFAAQAESERIGKEPNAGERQKLNLVQPPVHVAAPVEHWLQTQSEDQRKRHAKVRDKVMELTLAIADHPWWATLPFGTRLDAEIMVRRAAQELYDAEHAAAVG